MDKKSILLNLPEDIFEVMKDFKTASGMSYTNIMYNAITWWLVHKGLLDLSYIREKNKNGDDIKEPMINMNVMPSGVKFCSTEECEIDPLIEKIKK